MPIKPIVLQRRLAEVGRIRIGQVLPTKNGKTRPAKLDRLRFTSASRPLIEQVAAAYGGEVAEWTPANGGAAQWEVITDIARVPVIVPPASVSQYMENWSGGGCQRRCDGETEMLSGGACICAAQDSMICKPTTRLSVMLRDIPGLGVWRLESHGWNAAAELPDTAEFLARAGGYIGAWLYLKPQRSVKDGQTRDWMVPALEVENVTPAQLLAGNGAGAAGIGQPERAAIAESGKPAIEAHTEKPTAETCIYWARRAETLDELTEALRQVQAAGFAQDLTNKKDPVVAAYVEARLSLAAASEAAGSGPAALPAPATPAEPEPDPEKVWQDIVNDAGDKWTLSKLEAAFAASNDGEHPSTADGYRLAAFLRDLRGGWIEVPA